MGNPLTSAAHFLPITQFRAPDVLALPIQDHTPLFPLPVRAFFIRQATKKVGNKWQWVGVEAACLEETIRAYQSGSSARSPEALGPFHFGLAPMALEATLPSSSSRSFCSSSAICLWAF